ncbi:MAG: hypothetical protein NW206_02820 [Hyphomonadaceae bacterium]|nr:hypothetical protein [Hyphomonadaceae bacterium]
MLEGRTYCPVLHARVAEMKALFQLPAASKAKLFPTIVARPWPNAKGLDRTWEKILEATSGFQFALDLDRTRFRAENPRPAGQAFDALFADDDGFANYYEQVAALPGAIPVLRTYPTLQQLDQQLDHIAELDRGFVLRLEYQASASPLQDLDQVMARNIDFVALIDVGWRRDLLTLEPWAQAVVEKIAEQPERVETVVCGSSFPDSFTNVGARRHIVLEERRLFESMVRRFNAVRITYGDWASTRPPTHPTPMTLVPRIDLPLPAAWLSFRQTGDEEEKEDWSDIARRIVADEAWPNVQIWGTYLIDCTANELPNSIRSPSIATAARVNIHLYRQANFGAETLVSDGDEPYQD